VGRESRNLHVTNGDSARVRIEEVGFSGSVLAWRDVLHDGPVPAGIGFVELREVRAGFIAAQGWAPLHEVLSDFALRDRRLEEAGGDDEVVLWFEHDLYDQLQLIQVLDRIGQPGLASRSSLVQADRFFSDISDEELRELWRSREPVRMEQLDLGRQAWSAFRSPDPRRVEAVAASDTSALPFLAAALRRQLEEFPALADGLSRTERGLLQAIAAGATTQEDAFVAAQALEEAPFMGDWSAFARLEELAAGESPLVVLTPIGLTQIGELVLAREADRVELRGIQRWLGGVHLEGRAVWRWVADGACLVEA
jgi:hypothetical protein